MHASIGSGARSCKDARTHALNVEKSTAALFGRCGDNRRDSIYARLSHQTKGLRWRCDAPLPRNQMRRRHSPRLAHNILNIAVRISTGTAGTCVTDLSTAPQRHCDIDKHGARTFVFGGAHAALERLVHTQVRVRQPPRDRESCASC